MSERTHLRPYGAVKMEYGRFNGIKENSGQLKLEVKGNDYFSVKPEAGIEFKHVQPLAVKQIYQQEYQPLMKMKLENYKIQITF